MRLRPLKYRISHLLTAVLLLIPSGVLSAEMTVAELEGEDKENFDKFRFLFLNGEPDAFFTYAREYEKNLLDKHYMMLYYKLKSNEGFYALRHNMLFRAMQFARELDSEVHKALAVDYYYLSAGLMGDIFNATHDTRKAERYFMQALDEVGDRDPKFTMRMYLNIVEMLCLKDSEAALDWADKAIALSKTENNVEYNSLSLAMKAYVHFLRGDQAGYDSAYGQYAALREKNYPGFSPRYENLMTATRLAMDRQYQQALDKVSQGNLSADSSLVVINIHVLAGDLDNGFQAMKRRYVEMDSLYSIVQDANFNQMAAESVLLRSQQEAAANKKMVKRLTNWLIGLTLLYFFVYIMGRRRLVRKIWARNKELKAALARAEESDRMKSAFIRSMSHEIRTPLNAVAGFSQVLCSPDYTLSETEKQDMQQRIGSNVELITTIVNELLELSKSESEGTLAEVERADVACNDLCRSVMNMMTGRKKPDVEMRFTTNVDDNFMLHSNAYRLRNALTHLLDNALKFTEKGTIELSCQQANGQMLFSVADTGVGIAEKDRERIFDTFTKVDDFKEGVGLGLPICRRLVTSLGGTLELDAQYQGGSRFVITLPLA